MRIRILATCPLTLLALTIGCQGSSQTGSSEPQKAQADVETHAGEAAGVPGLFEGKVVSTQDGGGYTYVYLDDGSTKIWAAGPQSAIEVGDRVTVQTGMPMAGFRSEALDRTFEKIYFTTSFGDRHAKASPASSVSEADGVEIGEIARAESGYTVAELWGKKNELGDDAIVVRGRVVKFLPGIMNRNWIHLKDGTGEGESEEITVTTNQQTKVGDVILVRGQLSRDIDFGAGYSYELIIQDAAIEIE